MNMTRQILKSLTMLTFGASALVMIGCADPKTPIQLQQTMTSEKSESDGNVIGIPSSVSYVRLEPFGFVVEKPFPIIYFSSARIEAQEFTIESDVTLSEVDLSKVFAISRNIECVPRGDSHSTGAKVLEIITHRAFDKLTKCNISIPDACTYIKSLLSVNYEQINREDIVELMELSRRIDCQDAATRQ